MSPYFHNPLFRRSNERNNVKRSIEAEGHSPYRVRYSRNVADVRAGATENPKAKENPMTLLFVRLLFAVTLLLAAGLLGSALLRRRSAACRYSVLSCSLLGMLAVPLLLPFLSPWGVLPTSFVATVETFDESIVAQKVVPEEFPVVEEFAVAPPVFLPQAIPEPVPVLQSKPVVPAETLKKRVFSAIHGHFHHFSLGIWGAVSLLLLLRLARSWFAAKRLLGETSPLDDTELAELARRLGLRRPVSLRQSEGILVPLTVGVRRPVIVLPKSAESWTPRERRAVLTHELGHVARQDVLGSLFAEFCCAVYWFHPLVWLTARRMCAEREIACDDLVVLAGEDPPLYASLLLGVAANLKSSVHRRGVPACAVAMARSREVKRRIAAILDTKRLRKPLGRVGLALLLFLAAAGILLVSVLTPTKRKTTADEIERKKMLALAVNPDTPKLDIRGVVLLPDGEPAAHASLDIRSISVTFNRISSGALSSVDYNHWSSGSNNMLLSADKDGRFHVKEFAYPGSNVVVAASGVRENASFVSEPVVFVAETGMESLEIRLGEGVPIRGRMTYENGEPAAQRWIRFLRSLEPAVGADLPRIRNNVNDQRSVSSDDEGLYEIYLPPGEYTVSGGMREEIISVLKTDKDRELDWTFATPWFVEAVLPDGSSPYNTRYSCRSDGVHSGYLSEDGRLALDPVAPESVLFLLSKDGRFGATVPLTSDMLGIRQRIELEPSAKLTVQFVDAATKMPAENARVSVSGYFEQNSVSHSWAFSDAQTDAFGRATLDLPPGKMDIHLNIPGQTEIPIPAGGREIRSNLYRKIDLGPGETLDFGTIELTGVFRDRVGAKNDLRILENVPRCFADGKWFVLAEPVSRGPLDDPDDAEKNHVASAAVHVYLPDGSVKRIPLPNGSTILRGCCASKDGKFIFVTHQLARYQMPCTQVERGWRQTNAVSVLDAGSENLFVTFLLDDVDRGAANPWGVAVSEDGNSLYVALSGTHELLVVDLPGIFAKLDSQMKKTVDVVIERKKRTRPYTKEDIQNDISFLVGLGKRIPLPGKGPRDLRVEGKSVVVRMEFSDFAVRVDFSGGEPFVTEIAVPKRPNTPERLGELYFHDATLCFQDWLSCASCHPNGRPDGLYWDHLVDGMGNPKKTRTLVGVGERTSFYAEGLRDSLEKTIEEEFRGQLHKTAEPDVVNAIAAYLRSLKPVRAVVDTEKAERGKIVFDRANCTECHSGPYYTDSRKHDVGTKSYFDRKSEFVTPPLVELWRGGPFLHDGRFARLDELFTEGRHGLGDQELSEAEIDDLVQFLSSLPGTDDGR